MHTSLVATSQEFVANNLFRWHLEPAGPALVAIVLLWLSQYRDVLPAVATAVLTVVFAAVANQWVTSPAFSMALSALPACCFAGRLGWKTDSAKGMYAAAPLLILLPVGALAWASGLPRTFEQMVVVLPDAPSAFESKYFTNYADALQFAGLHVKVVHEPNEIPPNSLVFLPWLTQPISNDASKLDRFQRLARERGWTIIVAGEHTNLGGVAAQVEALSGRALLRRDLTVPADNTDNSGFLRAADVRGWRPDTMLNRGASVQIGSPTTARIA